MPYFPIAPAADDRRAKQGTAPIQLTNCLVRKTPAYSAQAQKAPLFIAPTPGRTAVADVTDNIRGIFCEPGCRNEHLFIAHGSTLSEMTSSLSYSAVSATLTGGDTVIMRADRSSLATFAFGLMYNWDGTTFTQVTDVDAPTFATTLAIVARRWIAAFQGNDAWGWSKSGLFNDWDPNGQAVDQDLPDPIVGQEEIGGNLWSFGSKSTQIWQPTGGAEDSAFARVEGVNIKVGLAGSNLFTSAGAGGMLIGHNRVVHGTSGFNLTPIPNPALEQALKALTATQLAAGNAWSYKDGAKEFVGFNFAGLDRAYVFDTEIGLWHERMRYGHSAYDVDYAATAFGANYVAGASSSKLWQLSDDVFTDDGDAIQREMTVHLPSQGTVPINRIVFHLKTRAVPLDLTPQMQVRTSNDNGDSWSDWRTLDLPTPSNRFLVQDFAWGLADPLDGMLIHIRISAAFGWAFWGVFVNPTDKELNALAA